MKKLFLIQMIVFYTFTTYAQSQKDSVLPDLVNQSFKAKYAKTKISEWNKTEGNYKITFMINNKWQEAIFNEDGTWVGENVMINYDELSPAIKANFEKSVYNSMEIIKIFKIKVGTTEDSYEFHLLDNKDNEQVIKYNTKGELIK